MKRLFTIGLLTLSVAANAQMTVNGSKLFPSEIECLESLPEKSAIICETRSDLVFCSTMFSARILNGGSESVQLQTFVEVEGDSKLWKKLSFGLTDKINARSARSEAKLELKELIKEVNLTKKCE